MFYARPAPSPRRHDLFAAGPGVLWGWVWIYPKTTRRAGSVHLGGRPRAFLFSSHFVSAPLQLLALVMPRQRQCSMYFPTLAAISTIYHHRRRGWSVFWLIGAMAPTYLCAQYLHPLGLRSGIMPCCCSLGSATHTKTRSRCERNTCGFATNPFVRFAAFGAPAVEMPLEEVAIATVLLAAANGADGSTAVAGAPLEIGELACQINALGGERRTQQLRKRHASYLLIRQVRNPNVTGLELPSGWRRKPGFALAQARSLFLAKGTMRRHEKEAGADDSDRKAHDVCRLFQRPLVIPVAS